MSLINTQVQPFKVNAFHNGKFIEVTDASLKPRILADTEALLATTLRDASGRWIADYVRLRFVARRGTKPDGRGHA